jgi:hypothetical protein
MEGAVVAGVGGVALVAGLVVAIACARKLAVSLAITAVVLAIAGGVW